MNMRLLQVFIAVCRHGGAGKAAEFLHTTQPAVSQALKQLERETGLVLFDRIANRLHLTGPGALFLKKATRLVEMADELAASAAGMSGTAAIRLGSCITIACYWLPELIARRGRGMEGLEVTVESAGAILEMAEDNAIDLALYEGPDPGPPFIVVPFSSYRLLPVCAPGHPLAGRRSVSLSRFLREPLLLREEGSAIRDVFDSHLRLRQQQAHPVMTSVNSQALIQAASAGLGVALLPDIMVGEHIAAGRLARFSVKEMDLGNENSLLYHRDKYLTASMAEFVELVRESG